MAETPPSGGSGSRACGVDDRVVVSKTALDRIALNARPQPLAHDREHITNRLQGILRRVVPTWCLRWRVTVQVIGF